MNIKTIKKNIIKFNNLFERRFYELGNKISEKNVVIYGSGSHTKKLIDYIVNNKLQCNVIGIADKEEHIGKECYGYTVGELEELYKECDTIIISSFEFQDIIYDRIKKYESDNIEIIKIYEKCDFSHVIERCYICDDYDLNIRQNVYFENFRTHISRYEFASLVTLDKNVLDIACGIGYGSSLLSDNATSVTGVDIDASSIQYGSKLFKDENIKLMVSSIENFKSQNKFDVVISFETIEHINNEKAYINKIKDCLSDEGIFIVSTPKSDIDGQSATNKYHVNEYTEKRFVDFLNENFQVVKLYVQKEENEGYITFRDSLPTELEAYKYTLIAVCKNKKY